MPECFVSAELREHGGPVPGYSFPWTYSVLPAKYRLPPVPFITGSGYAEHREIAHLMFAVHGYHRRRVHAWGRKSTAKMTGITRRLWYEAWFYVHNGYYRDVDPLARHPSETDVANGAPSDPDPQWPGIPEL